MTKLKDYSTETLTKELSKRKRQETKQAADDVVNNEKAALRRLRAEYKRLCIGEKLEVPFANLFIVQFTIRWMEDDCGTCYPFKVKLVDANPNKELKYLRDIFETDLDNEPYLIEEVIEAAEDAIKPFNNRIQDLINECDKLGKKYDCEDFFEEYIYECA